MIPGTSIPRRGDRGTVSKILPGGPRIFRIPTPEMRCSAPLHAPFHQHLLHSTIPSPGRITEPPVWPAALPLSAFRDGIELRLSGLA